MNPWRSWGVSHWSRLAANWIPFYVVWNSYGTKNNFDRSSLHEIGWRENGDPVVDWRACPAVLHRHPLSVFSLPETQVWEAACTQSNDHLIDLPSLLRYINIYLFLQCLYKADQFNKKNQNILMFLLVYSDCPVLSPRLRTGVKKSLSLLFFKANNVFFSINRNLNRNLVK